MSTLTNLRDVPKSSSDATPPQKFGDYFVLILKILVGFIVFCWWATSNYLNSLYIDTKAMYPVFGKVTVVEAGEKVERSNDSMLRNKGLSKFEDFGATTSAETMSDQYVNKVNNNPYATRFFNPGPIDMSNEEEINNKINLKWWMERTQQSSYQLGGIIMHYVFNAFKGIADKVDMSKADDTSKAGDAATKAPNILVQFFSFLLWLLFAILSNATFVLFLGLVFLMWIPGFLGGLTAFMPLTYYTHSPILKLCYKGLLLFLTFIWMCIAGWVTVFPVIYEFGHLLYLMSFKQIRDDSSRFLYHFMKRMKQLIYIYVIVSLIIAFTSKDLPDTTKITVASVFGGLMLLYIAYQLYQRQTK